MQKITPYLWFDNQAKQAAELYTSLFQDSKVVSVSGDPNGAFTMVEAEVAGQRVLLLNGGPGHPHSDSFSFYVECDGGQEEIDRLYGALTADGGEPGPCGWLTDKYGVSWQIIPNILTPLLTSSDPEVAQRVGQAMMTMSKIDIAGLEAAARG